MNAAGLSSVPPRARLRTLAALIQAESNPEIALALIRHAYAAADEAAREPQPAWYERLFGALPDVAAIAAFAVLGARGIFDGATVGALILAVLAGRLYPRSPRGPSVGGGGMGPPGGASGVLTLALGAGQLAGPVGWLARLRGG